MGLFDKLLKNNGDKKTTTAQQNIKNDIEELSERHMSMALRFYKEKNYKEAFDLLKLVAENTENPKAQYNLGSMYAQGLGIEQNLVEAAYWFNRAFKNNEEGADKLVIKCLLDYANTILKAETVEEIYKKLSAFSKRVYNAEEYRDFVRKNLLELGNYYLNNKKDYAMAAKLFRAGAEYENDAWCQNYLAVLYNAGAGVEKNDLAALYWFDKASERGVEVAKKDRDGIFNAYMNNLGKQETVEQLSMLVDWCTTGRDEDVPVDKMKANYWSNVISSL